MHINTVADRDRAWHKILSPLMPANVALHLVKEDISDAEPHLQSGPFDVIVVDGLDRYRCAERSLGLLAENGAILVDNAEGNHGPRPGYGYINLYREAGLARVDFYGYPPGNSTQ